MQTAPTMDEIGTLRVGELEILKKDFDEIEEAAASRLDELMTSQ